MQNLRSVHKIRSTTDINVGVSWSTLTTDLRFARETDELNRISR